MDPDGSTNSLGTGDVVFFHSDPSEWTLTTKRGFALDPDELEEREDRL